MIKKNCHFPFFASVLIAALFIIACQDPTASLSSVPSDPTVGNISDIIMKKWETAESVTLSENASLTAGEILKIPEGKTLVIKAGCTLTAGLLELASGTWKATGQTVSIEEDTISLWSDPGVKFGADDGTDATVLAGPFELDKATDVTTYTASGAKVTIGQNGNGLTITGAAAGATLKTGNTAGFWVKAGLVISGVTLDMSSDSDWCSVIYLDGSDGITLTDGNSVLLFNNDNEGTPYSLPFDSTDINTKITIGSSISVSAVWNNAWSSGGTNERFASFTGAANGNTITRKQGETVTIWLTKRLKFKD